MFKKAEEDYTLLKLEIVDAVATHLSMPLGLVDLSQQASG